jgi:DNA-binding NtrC family response regulator
MAKILIVEDEKLIAKSLKGFLEKIGHKVTGILAYGEEATSSIEKHRPDIVLMDIKLKGNIDGIEATGQINSRWDMPVIYLTAHSDIHTAARANKTKHCGFMKKPIDIDDLQITIESVLSGKKLPVR